MRYGFFDDSRREYVITRPDTPLPWINYLGSEAFFGLISNTAGGYSFYRDARLRRLTRYRYNNVPEDDGGRYFYIRDGEEITVDEYVPVIHIPVGLVLALGEHAAVLADRPVFRGQPDGADGPDRQRRERDAADDPVATAGVTDAGPPQLDV